MKARQIQEWLYQISRRHYKKAGLSGVITIMAHLIKHAAFSHDYELSAII